MRHHALKRFHARTNDRLSFARAQYIYIYTHIRPIPKDRLSSFPASIKRVFSKGSLNVNFPCMALMKACDISSRRYTQHQYAALRSFTLTPLSFQCSTLTFFFFYCFVFIYFDLASIQVHRRIEDAENAPGFLYCIRRHSSRNFPAENFS